MDYVVKERIGLPIWDDDFVTGTKHFWPGSPITDADFEEARQDADQQAELIHFNCWTPNQHKTKQEIERLDGLLKGLRSSIGELHIVDLDKMEIAVAPGREEEHARLLSDISTLTKKRDELEAELNAD